MADAQNGNGKKLAISLASLAGIVVAGLVAHIERVDYVAHKAIDQAREERHDFEQLLRLHELSPGHEPTVQRVKSLEALGLALRSEIRDRTKLIAIELEKYHALQWADIKRRLEKLEARE